MARMTTDDSWIRDPKLDHLAELVGWTRRETAGCLQLDVWPLCYDRVTPNLEPAEVDRVANRHAVAPVKYPAGFAAALVECGLARKSTRLDTSYHWERDDGSVVVLEWRDPQWKNRIYLRGAGDRIAYLLKKQASGRVGGKRSATTRASNQAVLKHPVNQCSSTQPYSVNPTVTVTVTPTDLDHTDPATPGGAPSEGLAAVADKAVKHAEARAAKVPDRAWKAADYLRDRILEQAPDALVRKEPWGDEVRTGWRLKWADEIRLMVESDGRTYEQIAEVMRFVFKEQSGDAKFVVEGATALRKKFDRIQAVRRNKQPDKQQKFANIPIAAGARRVS